MAVGYIQIQIQNHDVARDRVCIVTVDFTIDPMDSC